MRAKKRVLKAVDLFTRPSSYLSTHLGDTTDAVAEEADLDIPTTERLLNELLDEQRVVRTIGPWSGDSYWRTA